MTEKMESGRADAHPLLSALQSPAALRDASIEELRALAQEIRDVICSLSERRSIHFASNLGVVELAIALHRSFDFSRDRLVWDVGHQCYPHKLLTGRYSEFETIRTKGGLSGYPNPAESDYDLFMTGHAGCSVGTALGLALGDALFAEVEDVSKETRDESFSGTNSPLVLPSASRSSAPFSPRAPRHAVAVVGDGAFSSGPIFEALNHAGDLQQKLLVVLNDNKMSICKRVGGFGKYLDHLRMTPSYLGVKTRVRKVVENLPSAYAFVSRFKEALKTGLIGGALFEDLGFRYVGPIDGHDFPTLLKYFEAIKTVDGPVLMHVLTEKGRGYRPAEIDPSHYHSSSPAKIKKLRARSQKNAAKEADDEKLDAPVARVKADVLDEDQPFTYWAQRAITRAMREDPRVVVVVAAMTQGNMLEETRALFPTRFFDVGICEAHAVNLAAGLAKSGMRPIVDIYSGFLQRAYDHLFQEASLQNLPIIFSLDRAGFVGADGPTHHGIFDLSYLRPFPNMTVVAPADSLDMTEAFRFALAFKNGPIALRYPKTKAGRIDRVARPYERGRAEVLRTGRDGALVALGGELVARALKASDELSRAPLDGSRPALDVGVVNARFAKPFDAATILEPLRRGLPIATLEENALIGGFGAAALDAANEEGLDARALVRLGAPDRYIPHGTRDEELSESGLDVAGICAAFLRARARATRV